MSVSLVLLGLLCALSSAGFTSGSVLLTQPDAIFNKQYLVEANVTSGALIGTWAPAWKNVPLQPIDIWWLSSTTLLVLDFARGLFTVPKATPLLASPFVNGQSGGMATLGCPWSLAASVTSVYVLSMGAHCDSFPRIPFLSRFTPNGSLVQTGLLAGQLNSSALSLWAESDSSFFVTHAQMVEQFVSGVSAFRYNAFQAAIWDVVVVRNGLVYVTVLAPDAVIVFPKNSNAVSQTIWMQGNTGRSGPASSSAPNSFLFAPPASMWVTNSGNNGTYAVQHFVNGEFADGFGGLQCGEAPSPSDYLCGPFNGFKFTP